MLTYEVAVINSELSYVHVFCDVCKHSIQYPFAPWVVAPPKDPYLLTPFLGGTYTCYHMKDGIRGYARAMQENPNLL